MKNLIFLLIFICDPCFCVAQTSSKGYFGVSIGASFPLGSFKEQFFDVDPTLNAKESTSVGLQLVLANFGYRFSKNVGITASLYGNAYPRSSEARNYDLNSWACGAITVGPLLTFPIHQKLDLDIRPMVGLSVCQGQAQNSTPEPVQSKAGFIFDMGTTLRIHTSEKTSLMITMDFSSTKMKFDNNSGIEAEQKFLALTLGGGFAFRLR